jgi:hypothetical protein
LAVAPIIEEVAMAVATWRRESLLAGIAVVFLLADPVRAAGLNLSWLDCGASGVANRTFACNTNASGLHVMFGTFVAPAGLVGVTGFSAVLDAQSAGAAFPAWWNLRTGGCRAASLSAFFDFTGGPFNCHDYWQGGVVGGVAMDPPIGNRARIKTQAAFVLTNDPRIVAIAPNTEVYTFRLGVNNLKTVGLGSCAGCPTGVCIVLNSIVLTQPPGFPSKTLSAPSSRNTIQWQGGSEADCLLATPAKNATWGGIKSLYR